MPTSTHCRIAVLSMTNISSSNATGALLYRLFKQWPAENIIQVCKYKAQDEISVLFPRIITLLDFGEKARRSRNVLVRAWAFFIRRTFFFLRFYLGNKKEILAQLKAFQPDLLYLRVVDDPYYYLHLTRYLQRELQLPVVLHFMDDYELLLEKSTRRKPFQRIAFLMYRHYLRRAIREANQFLAISESMRQAFEKRYGVPFQVVHNGIEPEEYDFFAGHPYVRPEAPFRLVWAGSIASHKDDDIIRRIAQAVGQINAHSTLPVELLLNVPGFSVPAAAQLAEEFPHVQYQTYQPLDKYRELLATAHVLLIARNFDEGTRAYTQHSFHNKLPDYLASQTPILTIAPAWANTIGIFKEHGFGTFLVTDEVAAIAGSIETIMQHYPQHLEQARVAAQRAYDLYHLPRIREELAVLFNEQIRKQP